MRVVLVLMSLCLLVCVCVCGCSDPGVEEHELSDWSRYKSLMEEPISSLSLAELQFMADFSAGECVYGNTVVCTMWLVRAQVYQNQIIIRLLQGVGE